MFNPQPTLMQGLIVQLLLHCQILTPLFLSRHQDVHLWKRKRQEAEILQEAAPRRQGIRGGLGNPLVMDAVTVGVAQKEDRQRGIDKQDIFDGVILFLAAITVRLLRRILGADDAPFCPVMGKRGAAGMATGAGSSVSGATHVAASASARPRR